MKATFSFFLIISLFLISCPKDKTEVPENKITITGITSRDAVGELLGEEDTTDWNYDSAFPDEVSTLLNFTDTLDYSNADTATISIYAYPNPFGNSFSLAFSSTNATITKFIIVDESLNIYAKHTFKLNSGNHDFLFLSENLFPANKYYRMYYAFYDYNKTTYYKGHGDLKKK